MLAGRAAVGTAVVGRAASAAAPAPQPAPQPNRRAAAAGPTAGARRIPTYEETVVVSGSRTEQKLVDAPATMTVIGARTIESATVAEFRGAAAVRPRPEHHPGVGARHQRDEPGAHRHARDRPARAARRPQPVSGLLRVRDVGLPAGQPERDQADRSHPRAGVRRVGRQRRLRRDQRDHQVAARDAGHDARRSASARSTRTGSERMPGSLWYFERHARAGDQRSLGVQAVGGRLLAGCAVAADRHHPRLAATGHAVSGRSRTPARRSRSSTAGSTTTTRTAAKLSFSGGVAGTEGIMHTGIGPFDINSGSMMAYGRVELPAEGAPRGRRSADASTATRRTCMTRDPLGRVHPVRLQDEHDRRRAVERRRRSPRATSSRYGGNLRYNTFDLSIAPRSDNRTEFGVYAQDEIFLSNHFRWTVGARVDRFDYLDDFVFSPRTAFLIKPQENQTFRALLQPRLPVAVGHQQFPRRDADRADQPRRCSAPRSPAGSIRCRSGPWATRISTETSLDAYEVGYTGVVARPDGALGGVLREQDEERHLLHRESRSAAGRRPNPPPGWPLPPARHLPLITGGRASRRTSRT